MTCIINQQELVIIPAQAKVVEHVSCKYGCRNCENNKKKADSPNEMPPVPIKIASAPQPVIVIRREKTYKNGLVAVVSSGNIFDSVPPGETFIEKGQIVYHTLQIFGTMIRDKGVTINIR